MTEGKEEKWEKHCFQSLPNIKYFLFIGRMPKEKICFLPHTQDHLKYLLFHHIRKVTRQLNGRANWQTDIRNLSQVYNSFINKYKKNFTPKSKTWIYCWHPKKKKKHIIFKSGFKHRQNSIFINFKNLLFTVQKHLLYGSLSTSTQRSFVSVGGGYNSIQYGTNLTPKKVKTSYSRPTLISCCSSLRKYNSLLTALFRLSGREIQLEL